jgi:hypothetical protein
MRLDNKKHVPDIFTHAVSSSLAAGSPVVRAMNNHLCVSKVPQRRERVETRSFLRDEDARQQRRRESRAEPRKREVLIAAWTTSSQASSRARRVTAR